LWDIAGAGPSSKYVWVAYTKADDEVKRTVRPEILNVACAGWGVESVEDLTVAQAALTLNVVRSNPTASCPHPRRYSTQKLLANFSRGMCRARSCCFVLHVFIFNGHSEAGGQVRPLFCRAPRHSFQASAAETGQCVIRVVRMSFHAVACQ
jgi:hypothetical protein